MKFESYLQLSKELAQLRKLHRMGSFSFTNTQGYLSYQIQQKRLEKDKPLHIRSFHFEETAEEVSQYLLKYSSEYLRELIFIRIISALEAFFVDTLRDVFINTAVPFKNRDTRIELSVGEILSYESLDDLQNKILTKDKRALTSGGLSETEKYYKKVFDIEFTNFGVKYENIKEHYDRRHLFIHALGMAEDGIRVLAKTDYQYRAKYGTKKKELDVSKEYLEGTLDTVEEFAVYIHEQLISKITKPQWQLNKDNGKSKSNLHLIIQTIGQQIPELDPTYKFRVGQNVYTLSSFLEFISVKENIIELKLVGWEVVLNRYYRLIKKVMSSGKIKGMEGDFDGRKILK